MPIYEGTCPEHGAFERCPKCTRNVPVRCEVCLREDGTHWTVPHLHRARALVEQAKTILAKP